LVAFSVNLTGAGDGRHMAVTNKKRRRGGPGEET